MGTSDILRDMFGTFWGIFGTLLENFGNMLWTIFENSGKNWVNQGKPQKTRKTKKTKQNHRKPPKKTRYLKYLVVGT